MSDLIARLIAAGTPPELIAEVAMLAARAEVDREAIESRRTKDRERQASRRHVTSRDIPDVTCATPSLDKSPPDPQKLIPTPHTHGERAPAPTRGAAWACPEGVDPNHWRDFRANRRRKKLTDTDTAYQGQIRLLERFADDDWPPGRLVQHAAEMGWGKIVDPSEFETPRNGKRPANDHRNQHRRCDEIDDAARSLGFGVGILDDPARQGSARTGPG